MILGFAAFVPGHGDSSSPGGDAGTTGAKDDGGADGASTDGSGGSAAGPSGDDATSSELRVGGAVRGLAGRTLG